MRKVSRTSLVILAAFAASPAAQARAPFDLRLEWAQFYQGMAEGSGDKSWRYGGKLDALVRMDLTSVGAWEGFAVTAQAQANHGHSVNGAGGTLLAPNNALKFPGIEGSDRTEVMALHFTQKFGAVSVSVGKFNGLELVRATPLKGGGGIDTFWGNLAAPISGMTPPTFNGVQIAMHQGPVGYALMIYDPRNPTNRPLFSRLFEDGVTVNGSATLGTSICGLAGYYGVRAVYSNREGTDFSQVIQPPGLVPGTKKGSWLAGFSVQQYLVQDPAESRRGWGVFADAAWSDGNPNLIDYAFFLGVGGSGLVPGRRDDRFGLGYFRAGLSDALESGLSPLFGLRDESGVEAFYNVAVTPTLRFIANVQATRPAAAGLPRASFAGIGVHIIF